MRYLLLILALSGILYWSSSEAATIEERNVELLLTDNTEPYCGTKESCVILQSDSCRIITKAPRDYLDHWGLEKLGHELWHCFNGKEHKFGR